MELVALFYIIDEFCKDFEPKWRAERLTSGLAHRNKPYRLSLSEILTIIIHFHQSNHKTFKHYYLKYVCVQLKPDFPNLVSYNRFVELMGEVTEPMVTLLVSLLLTDNGKLHRFHQAGSLPQPEDTETQSLSRFGCEGQEFHGLVLRVQIAPYRQRKRRDYLLLHYSWQRTRQ